LLPPNNQQDDEQLESSEQVDRDTCLAAEFEPPKLGDKEVPLKAEEKKNGEKKASGKEQQVSRLQAPVGGEKSGQSDSGEVIVRVKRRGQRQEAKKRKQKQQSMKMITMDNLEAKKALLANSQSGSNCSSFDNVPDQSQASTSFVSSSIFGDGQSENCSLLRLDEKSLASAADEQEPEERAEGEDLEQDDEKAIMLKGSPFGQQQEGAREQERKSRAEGKTVGNTVLPLHCADGRLVKGNAVSRSMLHLDSRRAQFAVVWQELSFSYRQSFWNCAATGRGRGGAAGETQRAPAKQAKPVLKSVSGHFKSNELVAIIGPSGCGKTTLLQFLAGNQSEQQARMRIVGLEEPKVAFIGQDDSLLPGLTARETLVYASRLQNTRRPFDHAAHVQPILNELGLAECADRLVTKLSGGQAKRVTIAQELLYPTNLLILDEVTSGLDASTSYSIVKLLKYLVSDSSYPMSIVMSIHQPSARLFSVFDRVYLMSEGFCLYEGSCQVDAINSYLDQFGLQCPKYHNIADYLIEIACSGMNSLQPPEELVADQEEEEDELKRTVLSRGQPVMAEAGGGESLLPLVGSIEAIKLQMIEHQRAKSHDLIRRLCSAVQEGAAGAAEGRPEDVKGAPGEQQSVSLLVEVGPERQPRSNGLHRLSPNGSALGGGPHKQRNRESGGLSSGQSSGRQEALGEQWACQEGSLYAAVDRARSQKERPFLQQFLVHFQRSVLRIRRSGILTYMQFLTYILVGLQLATFYGPTIGLQSGCPQIPASLVGLLSQVASTPVDSETGDEEQEQQSEQMRRIQENLNFLLVAILTATFAALEITVITFPMEAKTVKREWRNGWYKVTSYFMGRTLADLPFTLIYLLVFSAIVYTMTGQLGPTSWRFVSFVAIILMSALIAQSFGFIFGALFMDNLPAAVFTAPMSIFPALLFSGFFSRVSQVPAFYKPLTVLSHFRYSFDALLVTLYGFDRCDCSQPDLDQYHAGLRSQVSSIRDLFGLLLGCDTSSDSATASSSAAAPNELAAGSAGAPTGLDASLINQEDLAAISASNSSLGALLLSTVTSQAGSQTVASTTSTTTTTQAPAPKSQIMDTISEVLTNSLFEQIKQNSSSQLNGTLGSPLLAQNATALPLEGSVSAASATNPEAEMFGLDRITYRISTRMSQMLGKQANFGHPMPRDCHRFNSYLLQEFQLNNQDLISSLVALFVFVLITRLICSIILNFTIARRAS